RPRSMFDGSCLAAQSGAPGAGGFEDEGPVARGEEGIADLSKSWDLVGASEHDAGRLAGGPRLAGGFLERVPVARVAVLAGDAQGLGQVIGSDVEDVEARQGGDLGKLR